MVAHRLAQIVAALSLLVLSLVALSLAASPALAQGKSAAYEQYDVVFEVQPDGRVLVTEDQTVEFVSGPFTNGYVILETRGAEAIEVLGVEEPDRGLTYLPTTAEGKPNTYRVSERGDEVEVRWWFPDVTDDQRRFVVRYVLHGALRFYDKGDQFWWKAIRADRPTVERGEVSVNLPDAIPGISLATGYRLPGGEALPMPVVEPRTARLRLPRLEPGEEIEVRVQWPHGAIAGTPSAFQQWFDVTRADEQAQIEAGGDPARALLNIVAALLALLVGLGGLVGLYVMWYTKGRDEPVSLPIDYLAEPPSDLAPGIVGTLLDERGELRDVLATLVDLARRGEMLMEERVEKGFMGLGERRDFVYRLTPTGAPLAPFEELLLDGVFDSGDERKLSSMKDDFYAHLPGIQRALYEASVSAGLFAADPEKTRSRYGWLAALGFVAAGLLLLVGIVVAEYAPAILCLPVSLAIVAAGALVVSRYMPRKTPAGADAAARWRAFRRYLEDIEEYRDIAEAGEIFDRYLPYAIAFGLDQQWIEAFARVDAEVPPWFIPWPHGGGFGRPWVDWGDGPSTLEGPVSAPGDFGGGAGRGLGRASDALGGGLSSMSTGLASMLNTAAVVMTSQPAPTGGSAVSGGSFGGGGWSGGGFSGGGGGGGGGGGFG